jgi:hypothetical protein
MTDKETVQRPRNYSTLDPVTLKNMNYAISAYQELGKALTA